MLPALAVLGIFQTESGEIQKQPTKSDPVDFVKKQPGTPLFITVERYGWVKSLPTEARLLSIGDTTYLKEQYLKGLDGYESIEGFDCLFAEASALE